MIDPIDDKETSNEMNEPRDSRCKMDSDCLKGEICSIIRILTSMPPQPVYGCMKPNRNPKSPKQGIKMTFRSSSYLSSNCCNSNDDYFLSIFRLCKNSS